MGESQAVVGRFVTEADWIPDFWNFLLGLEKTDLVSELVQNDLDQGASRTTITFDTDRLVCEGNGRPVEPDGWQRLRKIRGAGKEVPAKRGKIGVKNHGLKAAFTVGDEFELLSDGQSIEQTLYADGYDEPPRPAAFEFPIPNERAPETGCRIVIPYRKKNLEPQEGEAIAIPAPASGELDALFRQLCRNTPEQFAGVVSPELASRYEIVLRHHSLGEAVFKFSCSKPIRVGRITTFRRRCHVSGNVDDLPRGLQESVARRFLPLVGTLRKRVPDYFRRGERYFVEVSWRIDGRGKPQVASGQLRYPIGFPEGALNAFTGTGFFYSAPFVCDNQRHGPAENDATNPLLLKECEALAVETLARVLVSKWKAFGLRPLVPSPMVPASEERVSSMLPAIASSGGIPTVGWREAARLLHPTIRPSAVDRAWIRESLRRKYSFVLPVATWDENRVDPRLALVCPANERQVDPRIDGTIIRLLCNGDLDGFGKVFVTFDEHDAVQRAVDTDGYFRRSEDRDAEMSNVLRALAYADVVHESLGKTSLAQSEEDIREALVFPDTERRPTPLSQLHATAALPSGIPGLRLPPLLHPDLKSHALFRRSRWRLPKFNLVKYLEGDDLRDADEETRQQFWEWLRKHKSAVPAPMRGRLARLPIWPANNGSLHVLAELCEPRSEPVKRVLDGFLNIPSQQLLRSKLLRLEGSSTTALRRSPSSVELQDWMLHRLEGFEFGSTATHQTATELSSFEAELAILLRDTAIARTLRRLAVRLPAMAADATIQDRSELVSFDAGVDRLCLPGRFVARKGSPHAVQRLVPGLTHPTPMMLVSALREDPSNFEVLPARLRALISITVLGDEYRGMVSELPIVPVEGVGWKPNSLALQGTRGDFWGAWKKKIPAKDLSQERQRLYIEAGVTSAFLTSTASRQFFTWLSAQKPSVVESHVPCVLRHLLHRHGPDEWMQSYPDIPVIATRSRAGYALVSPLKARSSHVYLEDVPLLGDQLIAANPSVSLAISSAAEVAEPVTDTLRSFGVRSLKDAFGGAQRIEASGFTRDAPRQIIDCLERLSSRRFRKTFYKRLDDLGVSRDLIWRDWYDRVAKISGVLVAETVTAVYRFGRNRFRVPVDAALDPNDALFWLCAGRGDRPSAFYEAVAGQCVFKPEARRLDLLALAKAVELEILEHSFGRPDSISDEPEESSEEECAGDGEQGESTLGHHPFDPDPKKNVPQPGPIPTGGSDKGGRDRTTHRGKRQAEKQRPLTPAEEQRQTENLKSKQYAAHCQACLSGRSPAELAPRGSYVEWQEVRRTVIEAHHVDAKGGNGARHAGNLVLLCKYHHDNLGPRLTRRVVVEGLKKGVPAEVDFVDGATMAKVPGLIAAVVIPETGEIVRLFFTKHHADYWLERIG